MCVDYEATITREVVGLQFLSLGPQIAVHLGAILTNNCQVTELGLSGNAFGNPGCVALSKALATMPFIASVDLGSNDITEEGGLALAEAVNSCANPKWRTLCLDKNNIGDKAALAITDAVANGCKNGDFLQLLQQTIATPATNNTLMFFHLQLFAHRFVGKPDLLDVLFIKWNGLSPETIDVMRNTWASVKGTKNSAEACLAIN